MSADFWRTLLPLVHEHLPHTADATPEDIAYAVNQVNPQGLIRVDADELSYPFHIKLRFEIEQGLFDGSISVEELPVVWNAKMKQYFGVDVPTDSVGVLQDIHWSGGSFGYFPTYTLGAMAAAQLYEFMDRTLPGGMSARIASGQFAEIRAWLQKEFHSRGSLHPSLDGLLVAICGEPLNPAYFVNYLTQKYTKMYKLD
jgi:carboxypeptidase Taq